MPETDNYTPEQQLTRVAATIDQPDKFAKVFCEAAKSQKSIDDVLKGNIREIIQHDNEARGQIKGLLREIELEDFKFLLKKGGNIAIIFFSALGGSALTLIVSHFSK